MIAGNIISVSLTFCKNGMDYLNSSSIYLIGAPSQETAMNGLIECKLKWSDSFVFSAYFKLNFVIFKSNALCSQPLDVNQNNK